MANRLRDVFNTTEAANRNPAGFLLDAMVGGTTGAIERQESQGQRSFVASDTLPTRMEAKEKAALEACGFKFLGEVPGDGLFQYVELAPGWKKVRTDHSMWSELVDDKGRVRGIIFYKAAFYDRNAHMGLNTRFQIRKDYERSNKSGEVIFHIHDRATPGEAIVFSTEAKHIPPPFSLEKYHEEQALQQTAAQWLSEHYPDSANPAAYWD